jgi:hypothetical protein
MAQKKSALRKLIELLGPAGTTFADGTQIIPLESNCIAFALPDGRAILSDMERQREYPSLEAALDTTFTRNAFRYGTPLPEKK